MASLLPFSLFSFHLLPAIKWIIQGIKQYKIKEFVSLFFFLICLKSHKVVRSRAANIIQLSYLRHLQSSDETLDFWSEPFRVGQPVDIHVNSDNYDALAHLLNSAGIQNHIKVEDLGRAIEEERVSIEFRRELTKNQKAFDFENYHTYEEVKKNILLHNKRFSSKLLP